MTSHTTLIASGLVAASLVSATANAALQGRDLDGNLTTAEAYYDTDLDITWLADANYAWTSAYNPVGALNLGGAMDWGTAYLWAANLSFTDGVNVYDNWRLPATLQPDASCGGQLVASYGYNCTGSEMGHLFYAELGGTAGSLFFSADSDLAKFTNLQDYGYYWSATEYANNTGEAWYFDFSDGYQLERNKGYAQYAWAVSPGDVGVAAVPEAQTYALMLAGLGLVGLVARRQLEYASNS